MKITEISPPSKISFSSLPDEILSMIVGWLSNLDLYHFRLACKCTSRLLQWKDPNDNIKYIYSIPIPTSDILCYKQIKHAIKDEADVETFDRLLDFRGCLYPGKRQKLLEHFKPIYNPRYSIDKVQITLKDLQFSRVMDILLKLDPQSITQIHFILPRTHVDASLSNVLKQTLDRIFTIAATWSNVYEIDASDIEFIRLESDLLDHFNRLISSYTRLKCLKCTENNVEVFQHVKYRKNFTSIEYQANKISSLFIQLLSECDNLKHLKILSTTGSPSLISLGPAIEKKLCNLETLHLENFNSGHYEMHSDTSPLKYMKTLKTLVLDMRCVNTFENWFHDIRYLTSLKTLQLRLTFFDHSRPKINVLAASLECLPKLKHLELDIRNVDIADIFNGRSIGKLEKLCLYTEIPSLKLLDGLALAISNAKQDLRVLFLDTRGRQFENCVPLLKSISNAKHLTHLTLNIGYYHEEELKSIFTYLKELLLLEFLTMECKSIQHVQTTGSFNRLRYVRMENKEPNGMMKAFANGNVYLKSAQKGEDSSKFVATLEPILECFPSPQRQ